MQNTSDNTDDKEESFSAEEFVRRLLTDGDRVTCDDTNEVFNETQLPEFYDDDKFKRGQKFYHKNIAGMFFAKFIGLVVILVVPKAVKILRMTKMSSTPMTAYRRYLSTVFHMCLWYDKDFHPGSISWKSITTIKDKHSSASKRACTAGHGQITQTDMALAQFGFMGFALVRSDQVGIHNATDEELESFMHVWRVLGRAFGIDDKYNICRESLSETKAICELILMRILKPEMARKDSGSMELSGALLNGMWSMNPLINTEVFRAYIELLLAEKETNTRSTESIVNNNTGSTGSIVNNNTDLDTKKTSTPESIQIGNYNYQLVPMKQTEFLIKQLNLWRKIHFYYLSGILYLLKYTFFRHFFNFQHICCLWLMVHCPFLAYPRFGFANSHVQIMQH